MAHKGGITRWEERREQMNKMFPQDTAKQSNHSGVDVAKQKAEQNGER